MSPEMTVGDAMQLKLTQGFSGFPVTSTGEIGSQLVGFITGRDFDFLKPEEYVKSVTEVYLIKRSEACRWLLDLDTRLLMQRDSI